MKIRAIENHTWAPLNSMSSISRIVFVPIPRDRGYNSKSLAGRRAGRCGGEGELDGLWLVGEDCSARDGSPGRHSYHRCNRCFVSNVFVTELNPSPLFLMTKPWWLLSNFTNRQRATRQCGKMYKAVDFYFFLNFVPIICSSLEPGFYVFGFLPLTSFSFTFYNKFVEIYKLFPCKTAYWVKRQKILNFFLNLLFMF